MSLFRRRRLPAGGSRDRSEFVYEMLVMRELDKDALMWQAPALAMTAQAFLITMAFDSSASEAARVITAALGILVSGMSMQLMARHRLLGLIDRAKMWELEQELQIPHLSNRSWAYENGRLTGTPQGPGSILPNSFWNRQRSYRLWQTGLACFIFANICAIVLALLRW